MKKTITIIFLIFFIIDAVFSSSGCSHSSTSWNSTGSNSKTIVTKQGQIAQFSTTTNYNSSTDLNYLKSVVLQSVTFSVYGLGNATYYNDYDDTYQLVYIGGQFYTATDSDDWSESSYICNYLYPQYINYLRPYYRWVDPD